MYMQVTLNNNAEKISKMDGKIRDKRDAQIMHKYLYLVFNIQ